MPTEHAKSVTYEREVEVRDGWRMLFFNLALLVAGPALIIAVANGAFGARPFDGETALATTVLFTVGLLLVPVAIVMLAGHFTLQPNQARVLILFGSYKGTVRRSGFHWANPFYSRYRSHPPGIGRGSTDTKPLKTKLSLRVHNFNSEKLKVNDKRGNPVEIAAVVVWRIEDTAQAAFDVEDYDSYVQVQSESAIRSIASLYAYDHGEEDEVTLRGGGDEIAQALKKELEVRLATAGVFVEEARLTHLAYAPEIASAMLRRQQAEAIIAARRAIVRGAVSMVDMALRELDEKDVVQLDEERKAAMVSNLLVVLCGTSEASPVINTGTLYT